MLIDSNIWIYALNRSSPKHSRAQIFLRQRKKLFLAQQNVFETIRVLTHPKFTTPFKPAEAARALEEIINNAAVIYPTPETTALALELLKKYSISGTEVFDAYLVATALSHQIKTIASDNVKHLQKYQEIQVVNPFF